MSANDLPYVQRSKEYSERFPDNAVQSREFKSCDTSLWTSNYARVVENYSQNMFIISFCFGLLLLNDFLIEVLNVTTDEGSELRLCSLLNSTKDTGTLHSLR
ncbi:hypothetical protein AVEN_100546-1 [Araneus ventricosus]|uniref:Uncharacterized protein n=1 Tax=Araneus ventricosus TaxID=182803 RepID=A0A4Y2I8V8_ARAVE|nr:hypothetical protein AVEN_100546-1 [Araneus ventricosus]